VPVIVADAGVKLLGEDQHSRSLGVPAQRKRNELAPPLARRRVGRTAARGGPDGAAAVSTPEYPHNQDTAWTLVIFSDLDTLASGDRQSQTLAALRRRWAIATFSDADWFRNNIRVERILYALQLDITDFPAFARHCMATFSN